MLKLSNVQHPSYSKIQFSFLLLASWCLYPFILKIFHDAFFKALFIAFFIIMILNNLDVFKGKRLSSSAPDYRLIIVSWTLYLVFLLIASLYSGDKSALFQFALMVSKVCFLIFLLVYFNFDRLTWSINLYERLCLIISFFAIATIFFSLLNVQPITSVYFNGIRADFFGGTFYTRATMLFKDIPVYRIQGLSEEPGTFAFAILPAFYWSLIKNLKSKYIHSAALILSLSLGSALTMLILLPLVRKVQKIGTRVTGYTLFIFASIFTLYVIASFSYNFDEKAGTTTLIGKSQSLQDRSSGITKVIEYLMQHPQGTGASIGSRTIQHPISVGYATAVLESGILGGFFYILLFSTIAVMALKCILFSIKNLNSNYSELATFSSLAILVILFMGLQRSQPDLSLWHMWIIALFLYTYREVQKNFSY